MDEFELIERYFAPLGRAADGVAIGIGDDAAVIDPTGAPLAVAVDTLVSGVHFPRDTPAADVGYRVVAVNLSDLAAMGAEPRYATLALTLPSTDEAWLAAFARGFSEACVEHGVALVGGDTTRGPLTVTVQLIGRLHAAPVTRSGGRPGDVLLVSGTLGDAAGGLACLQERRDSAAAGRLVRRFRRPSARVALGRALATHAHAAIDVSDGLFADLRHLAARSACAAEVDPAALPVSDALVEVFGPARARSLAADGDDYELLLAVPPAALDAALDAARVAHTALTRIGRLVEGEGVHLVDADGRRSPAPASGYRHFD